MMLFVIRRSVSLLCFVASVSSFNIAFPSNPPAHQTFGIAWSRDKEDPQFFFQKIKLADAADPTAPSTPFVVQVTGSDRDSGFSPISFNRAGLYQILAVNIGNGQMFFTTEVTVVTNPTSTGGPPTSVPTPSIPNDNEDLASSSTKDPPSSSKLGTTNTASAAKLVTSTVSGTGSAGTTSSNSSPTGTGSSHPSSAMIIGIVIGIIGFLFLVAGIVLCIRYRRRGRISTTAKQAMGVQSRAFTSRSDKPPRQAALACFWRRRRAGQQSKDVESQRLGRNDRHLVNPDDLQSDISAEQQHAPSIDGITFPPQVETSRSSQTISTIGSRAPSAQSLALTERQVQLRAEAGQLRQQMLALVLAEDSSVREMLGELIERMRVLEARVNSDWARGLTDERPPPDYFSFSGGGSSLTLREV